MPKMLEIRGYVLIDNIKKEFYLMISKPIITKDDDYYCEVHIPVLFDSAKHIFGINELQAKELAISFVKKILCDYNIVNGEGESISLEQVKVKP